MTIQLAPQILRFESLPSTNLEAARRALEGAPEGVCVLAAEQTAGRGRLQRNWVSPKDAGLYFTIILRPQMDQSIWPLLSLMAAVAVHDALLESCHLETDIKWPNDVLFNEKKLCGILAESADTPFGRAVVVGIGINLNDKSYPSELEPVATSVEAASGQRPDLEIVLQELVNSVIRRYQELHLRDGGTTLVDEYCARSSYCNGKRVRVNDNAESFVGTTRGIEPDGALRVETENGEVRIVRAADVENVRAAES